MAKQNRRRSPVAEPSPFEQARDEMFQHIMRCGVIGSDPEHQGEWFDDTMKYFGERYPELSDKELGDLRALSERFVQPPKAKVEESQPDAASAA